MAPIPTSPAYAIAIQGDASLLAHPACYVQINNKGPETNYLDIPIKGILSPSPFNPPSPGNPVQYLVDVNAQLRFSDYMTAPTIPLPVGPVHVVPPAPAGLYGNDGTSLGPSKPAGQVTGLMGTTKDNTAYSLTLSASPAAYSPGKASWAAVWVSLSKIVPGVPALPPLEFTIAYNPLDSQFGVGVLCGKVSLGIFAQMSLIYSNQENVPPQPIASLERSITYYSDSFGTQTISMAGTSTDPEMYLPVAGVFWPYTDLFGFFAPAFAYLASQTWNALALPEATPLSILAQLQYDNNKGLEYHPAWSLDQFIANTTVPIGTALGLFAAEFLPPGDSGIQSWIDAAHWMAWVLAKGTGVPSLTSALATQYDFWKSYVPSSGKKTNPISITKKVPGSPLPGPGERIWQGRI